MRYEELRTIWMEMAETARAAESKSRATLLEDRLKDLYRERYEHAEARLNEGFVEAGLQSLLVAAREGRAGPDPHLNGEATGLLRKALDALFRPSKNRRLSWVAYAILVLLVGMAWLAFDLPGASQTKRWIVGTDNPNIVPPTPQATPRLEPPQAPPQQAPPPSKEEPIEPHRAAPSAPEQRGPHRSRTLLAQRVEVGQMASVLGDPKVRNEGEASSKTARSGERLYAGALLKTGDADRLEFRFADESTIGLDFNTAILLPPPSEVRGRVRPEKITVLYGRVFAKVNRSATSAPFEVRTRAATAEVLGTAFSVGLKRAEDVLRATLQVEEGRVAFYNEHGRVVAGARTESTAISTKAPTEPQPIQHIVTFRADSQSYVGTSSSPLVDQQAVAASDYEWGWIGARFGQTSDGGIWLIRIDRDSPADRAGLQLHDVVLAVNGRKVTFKTDVERTIMRSPRDRVLLTVRRGAVPLQIAAKVETRSWNRPIFDTLFEARLRAATDHALFESGDSGIRRLEQLASQFRHPAAYNNLGVAHEKRGNLVKAAHGYIEAAQLSPKSGLYHLNLGRVLRLIGNEERGLEELRLAHQIEPDRTEVALALASALGDNEESLRILEESSKADSQNFDLAAAYVECLLNLGKYAEALEKATELTKIAPNFVRGWTLLGNGFHYSGRLAEAETPYRKALEIDPADISTLNDLGALLLRLRGPAEAAEVLARLTRAHPDFAIGHYNYGSVLIQLRRFPEAEPHLRRASVLDRNSAFFRKGLGDLLRAMGKNAEAEIEYKEAIRLDPKLAAAHLGYALLLNTLKRYRDAETALRASIAAEPRQVNARVSLAKLLESQQRFNGAELEYRRLIAAVPTYPQGYTNLAWLLASQKRHEEALAMFRRAAEIDPKSATTRNNIASVLHMMGKVDEAEAEYRKALEIDPKYAQALHNLGYLLYERNELAEAEKWIRAAISVNPKMDVAYYNLGRVLAKAGRHDEAIASFKTSIELYATSIEAAGPWYELGLVYERKSDLERARESFQKALSLVPKYANAANALKRVGGTAGESLAAHVPHLVGLVDWQDRPGT